MHTNKITTFYNEKQAIKKPIGYSHSPLKPYLLMEKLNKSGVSKFLTIKSDFSPFQNEDFEIAHTPTYIKNFFEGKGTSATSNGLEWNKQFAESVRYTNSSLYHAQRYALENPECITFSPTSGFHHARPEAGSAFCTFSGQVISALKLYRDTKLTEKYGTPVKTAWIDLDGHFGNSIGDAQRHAPDIKKAIPEGFNLNPGGYGKAYLENLKEGLENIATAILKNEIQSVCFAQGADSHEEDDLGGQVGTEDWIRAHELVFEMIKNVSITRKKAVPLTLSLFGGYRQDDYDSVLNLHTKNLISCLNILCDNSLVFEIQDEFENGSRKPRIVIKDEKF
jgi:acetoin utilization deacetylase AcuC-like enzyme